MIGIYFFAKSLHFPAAFNSDFFQRGWITFFLNVGIDLYSHKFQKPN